MRTFRLIGMAVIAIMMCVNFAACSSDDDEIVKSDDEIIKNEDGIITNQKKLIEIKDVGDKYTHVTTFAYDSKGRVISAKIEGGKENEVINFAWANSSIVATSDGRSTTYSLTEGLVRTSTDDNETGTYTYDSSNQLLILEENKDEYISNYTWNNGGITKYVYKSGEGNEPTIYEYTYSGKTCKGWYLNIDDEAWDPIDNDMIFFAHPELVGMRTTQLPDQCHNKSTDKYEYYDERLKETCKTEAIYEETIKYTYKLNSDGYVESVTGENTELKTYKRSFEDRNGDGVLSDDERNVSSTNTDTSERIYTFKWE